MDHALVPLLQTRGGAVIVFSGIPFIILSFCGVRGANRGANVIGFLLLFYVTIGQLLWSLPFYGTHWSFDGAMLLADGVTCPDGCPADPITLAIRNYGNPVLVLMIDVGAFLLMMAVAIGVSVGANNSGRCDLLFGGSYVRNRRLDGSCDA